MISSPHVGQATSGSPVHFPNLGATSPYADDEAPSLIADCMEASGLPATGVGKEDECRELQEASAMQQSTGGGGT